MRARAAPFLQALALCLGLVAPPTSAGPLSPPLRLEVDNRFPVLGGSFTLTLKGPPGADYTLWLSNAPKEFDIPGWGTGFLDTSQLAGKKQGVLSLAGEDGFVAVVPTSDSTLAGRVVYLQAVARLGPDQGVSNAISLRPGLAPPSGARKPEAVAVTPDGSKAYVAHEKDGSVSVLDAVADVLLFDMPVSPVPPSVGLPVEVAVDPEGRHAFVISPQLRSVAVIHTATDSIAAQIPVPAATRDITFDFRDTENLLYLTNERDHAALVFREAPPGTFTFLRSIPLEGMGPGPIALLPSGLLIVGHRQTNEIEVVDPAIASGAATVARTRLGSPPLDIVVSGSRVLVPTFTPTPGMGDGRNEVLEVETTTFQVVGAHLVNAGTDYFDALVSGEHLVLVASGSGSVVVADPAAPTSALDVIDLAPGQPVATPTSGAFVPAGSGMPPRRLYITERFRETVRPIDLSSGPPFALMPEIALAHLGRPRIPLADLTPVEDGQWFFESVQFFNGTPQIPNPVTCATCHWKTFSDGVNHPRQAPPLFDVGSTGPWTTRGSFADLLSLVQAAFNVHGRIGGAIRDNADGLVLEYLMNGTRVPLSPFLEVDGSLSAAAQAGKLVFEGAANCSSCHTGPLFIPVPPNPLTIAGGVGTGLDPANVPSLRGLWASAPYLHNGSAARLMDVLLSNPEDRHGITSVLTQQELDDLVEYLRSH